MNNNKLGFICIIAIILLTGCNVGYDSIEVSNKNDLMGNVKNASITENVVLDDFSVNISDIEDLKKYDVTGIIYFGRDTCPNCINLNPLIKKVLERNDSFVLYKFDTDVWRAHPDFEIVLNQYKVDEIPAIVKVNENKQIEKMVIVGLEEDELLVELYDFLSS